MTKAHAKECMGGVSQSTLTSRRGLISSSQSCQKKQGETNTPQVVPFFVVEATP